IAAAKMAINFHDGPLPEIGGRNVTSWSILHGHGEHGVTWHVMTAEVDGGDILVDERFPLAPDVTALGLNAKCFEAGSRTYGRFLDALEADALERRPQPGPQKMAHRYDRPGAVTVITPASTLADLRRVHRALAIGDRVLNEMGSVRIVLNGSVFLVGAISPSDESLDAGQVRLLGDGRIAVGVADGVAELSEITNTSGNAELPSEPVLWDDSEAIAAALEADDPAMSRAETFWTARLAARSASILRVAESATDRTVALAPAWRNTGAVAAALAAVVARFSEKSAVSVTVVDQAASDRAAKLGPLARLPFVNISVDPATPSDAFVTSGRTEAERSLAKGAWLADLAARCPKVRAHQPGGDDIAVVADGVTTPVDAAIVVRISGDHADVVSRAGSDLPPNWLDAFAVLVANDPTSTAIGSVDLRSDSDRALLASVNANDRPLGPATAIEQILANLAAEPLRPSLAFGRDELTRGELLGRVAAQRATLEAQGIGAGDLVGIATPRGLDMVVAVLGTLATGAAYVPLDPGYPTERLQFMVEDAGLAAVIAPERPDWLSLDLLVVHPATTQALMSPAALPTLEDLAYVIYTSGSTGKPKGVMLEHGNLANFLVAMDEVIDHDPAGTWLAVTSLSFDISILELIWTLSRGFSVVLLPDDVNKVAAAPRNAPTLSLYYFASEGKDGNFTEPFELLLDGARFADAHGFEAVWTPERHFHDFGGPFANPSVSSAAVAAITKNIKIRAGSCVIPLHHPVRVAEEWAMVDNISGGRVGIAVASGWMPNDFILKPESYGDNKQVMVDFTAEVCALWRGETRTYEGPRGPVTLRTLPRPVQKELPVWVTTAGNPQTFVLAGKLGYNVLTHLLGQSVEEVAERTAMYRKARAEAGHEGPGQVTLMLHTYVGDDGNSVRNIVRQPLKNYLRSSISLVGDIPSVFPTFAGRGSDLDSIMATLNDDEKDQLLEAAFERYYERSGLFGDIDSAYERCCELKSIGVDEVACLIDFGIPNYLVQGSFPRLAELARRLERLRKSAELEPTEEPAVVTVGGLIARHNVTHLQCTPSQARMLVADAADREALKQLRHVLIGGEAFPPDLADELRSVLTGRLTNMYGPTETTIWSLISEITGPTGGKVPIGKPIANTTIMVADAEHRPVPGGVAGELLIGGLGVARGYLHRPELTAERFVDVDLNGTTQRMYSTGDLVRLGADGVTEFLGRLDFQVKL
ncbi:MAG: MupA/Atu3671 family FMN-dependent luciferase-like monooxygenase, partial [Acidimicrobiia bacterium]